MKSFKFIISGRVQGVFYRKYTSQAALDEGFSGYVKNLPSGSVEACVTCKDGECDKFLSILKKGSPHSIVEKIERFNLDEIYSGPFEIRY